MLGLGQIILGSGFFLGAAAELLPRHKTKLAASLRALGITFRALSVGIILAALWLILV